MAVDATKILGYGGSGEVDGKQILITSGGFTQETNPSFLDPLSMPVTAVSRSRILHADGTEAYGGSISFDVSDNFLDVLTTAKLLSRGYKFNVGVNDGTDAYEMTDCYLASLSLSGAPGGLITGSISFVSAAPAESSLTVLDDFIRDTEILIGYWYSDNTGVRDWSFTMNQATTPVYGNVDAVTPNYIKFGMIDFSLDVTTYEAIVETSVINIATRTFTLTGVPTSEEYSFAGVTDLGNYKSAFVTAASSAGSDGIIIA